MKKHFKIRTQLIVRARVSRALSAEKVQYLDFAASRPRASLQNVRQLSEVSRKKKVLVPSRSNLPQFQ